ncbi:hypothetical protein SEA_REDWATTLEHOG_114 [Gordonia phage RedWattleHog]|uniref:Uncharacterized protein n=1 Tax=Gordonia phage Stormageddon TaxID=2656541 RepID=A0A649VTT5_9CAUD|nr:hypothetical protein KHQ86_gp187 [Gordonia phage Stormageddon]QGJ94973.1 hypothetical protein SEA_STORMAGEDDON_113 [Gordonia phage Stormageddon]QLF83617.1 hypothetical protein SEA_REDWATTLEHOG_114 [Gordonia phage RedWattleHog]
MFIPLKRAHVTYDDGIHVQSNMPFIDFGPVTIGSEVYWSGRRAAQSPERTFINSRHVHVVREVSE